MAGALLELPDPEREDAGVYRPVAEMNVTPMVDVMLVLLIIFMVAAPLMTVGVPVALPKTSAAKVAEQKQSIVVSIDKDGRVYLDKELLAPETIAQRLKDAAATNPDQVVMVRGDRTIDYGRVIELMGNVNAAGFSKVSLIAEPAPAQTGGVAGTPSNP